MQPSRLGAFFGRAVRGDWAGAAQAAAWPVVFTVVAALALGAPSYGQSSGDFDFIGFGTRTRIALALLLKGVGGGFEVHAGGDSEGGGIIAPPDGGGSLHGIPLTVTALWIVVFYVGLRLLRSRLARRAPGQPTTSTATPTGPYGNPPGAPYAPYGAPYGNPHGGLSDPAPSPPRPPDQPPGGVVDGAYRVSGAATAGLEAAVRVAVLVAAATLVLALFAQPAVPDVTISSSPAFAALGALLLGLTVCAAVLHRDEAARWLATRPGTQVLLRAIGIALRALTVTLLLSSLVAFALLTQIDGLDEKLDMEGTGISPLLLALLVLPNLGLAALGLGWGAEIQAKANGPGSFVRLIESFGRSDLSDLTGSAAVVGTLALGLVCVLTMAVLAARRAAGRGEHLLVAGVFLGLVLLLTAIGGAGLEAHATSPYGSTSSRTVGLGLSEPDVLLFGLLWVFGAVLLVPPVMRALGARGRGGRGPG